MATQIQEEDLLRSIEEVEAKIKNFRHKVRAVLDAVQEEQTAGTIEQNVPSGG
jgi:hypothetical protein